MLAYIVLGSIIVCSLAFVMWLAMFILSRGINTNLETVAESRRIARRQLIAGAVLLAIAISLGFYYRKLDHPELIPRIGPGLPLKAPMVQEEIRKESAPELIGTDTAVPPEVESAPSEEPDPSVSVEQDNLQPVTQ